MKSVRWLAIALAAALGLCLIWQFFGRRPPVQRSNQVTLYGEETTDPADDGVRFLLLAPGGPLIIDATIALDGQPFRRPREKLLDEVLAQADTDGDGLPTWTEAFANPRFAYGRFTTGAHERQSPREQTIKVFDRDGDGRMNRAEARFLLAQSFGGGSLSVQGFRQAGEAVTWQLLDADHDGLLSPDELAATAQLLARHDLDENELLLPAELSDPGNRDVGFKARVAVDYLLLPLTTGNGIANAPQALAARYAPKTGTITSADWPRTPTLFALLDVNGNDRLEPTELARLGNADPQARLSLAIDDDGRISLRLEWTDGKLAPLPDIQSFAAGQTQLTLPNLVVRLEANPNGPQADTARAELLVRQLDGNNNGYIERTELTGDNREFATQYSLWDADGNGRVAVAEIVSYFETRLAPQRTQVGVLAAEDEDPTFALLDADGDGRLGLRETQFAAQRLLAYDGNRDGLLAQTEVPNRITLSFGRGPAQFDRRVTIEQPTAKPQATTEAPTWFVRMDRNGDGDVSSREFLGSPDQFTAFDADADGLLDAAEAAAVR